MELSKELKSKLDYCISESNSSGVISLHIMQNFTVYELETIVAFLVSKYEQSHNLLSLFNQSRSDNCLLEASQQEQQELDFSTWVKTNT